MSHRSLPASRLARTASVLVPFVLAVCACALGASAQDRQIQDKKKPVREDAHQLDPTLSTKQLIERAVEARKDGLDFLVRSQNKDGTWGSHDPQVASLKDFGFQTGNRGSNDGVRLACTAICAHALMETPNRTAEQQAALFKAQEALLDTAKFAYNKGESFNIWGYCYKLDFLTRWLSHDDSKPFRDRIRTAAAICIEGLAKYQQHEGGWGYYASPMGDFDSMSFTTANMIICLKRAEDLGLPVKKGMVDDAARILQLMRVPDGSFVYSSAHRNRPSSMLKKLGAGSRTVVAALALHTVGRFDRDDILTSFAVFKEGENYLEDGRKLIQPHTAVHQISGYFYFYGYNYATELAMLLGKDYPQERWDRLAWTMIRTQEEDGSWWDTAAADYGNKWGTGFALLSLQRYLDTMAQRGQRP